MLASGLAGSIHRACTRSPSLVRVCLWRGQSMECQLRPSEIHPRKAIVFSLFDTWILVCGSIPFFNNIDVEYQTRSWKTWHRTMAPIYSQLVQQAVGWITRHPIKFTILGLARQTLEMGQQTHTRDSHRPTHPQIAQITQNYLTGLC